MCGGCVVGESLGCYGGFGRYCCFLGRFLHSATNYALTFSSTRFASENNAILSAKQQTVPFVSIREIHLARANSRKQVRLTTRLHLHAIRHRLTRINNSLPQSLDNIDDFLLERTSSESGEILAQLRGGGGADDDRVAFVARENRVMARPAEDDFGGAEIVLCTERVEVLDRLCVIEGSVRRFSSVVRAGNRRESTRAR